MKLYLRRSLVRSEFEGAFIEAKNQPRRNKDI